MDQHVVDLMIFWCYATDLHLMMNVYIIQNFVAPQELKSLLLAFRYRLV
jgi:hypothetical protein